MTADAAWARGDGMSRRVDHVIVVKLSTWQLSAVGVGGISRQAKRAKRKKQAREAGKRKGRSGRSGQSEAGKRSKTPVLKRKDVEKL